MSPRSKQEDAYRKRRARAKQRDARQAAERAISEREREQQDWQDRNGKKLAALLAKLDFDAAPERADERISRAVEWIAQAEKAHSAGDLTTLGKIAREIRSALGGDYPNDVSILQFESWDGCRWRSVSDVRLVLMADLESRGLLQRFEQAI